MSRIDVMRPWLGQEEVDALAEVVASGWIAQGPRVARFEEAFAAAMGDDLAAERVVDARCLPAVYHDRLEQRLRTRP